MAVKKQMIAVATQTKKRPRSRHLTHPYPMWQGCTFMEMIMLTVVVIVALLTLAILISLFVGYFKALLLIFGLFIYHSVFFTAKQFARYKKGKPYNFIMLDLGKRLGFGGKIRINRSGAFDHRRTFTLTK